MYLKNTLKYNHYQDTKHTTLTEVSLRPLAINKPVSKCRRIKKKTDLS
jgi:hypothetical protein